MAIYVDGTKQTGSGGGGTGGGHIFLDNEGTAMPQRAKAKFEGAYSTDNSTDGITNVAVMRTMKAMEYAQLTGEEKQGMIYVDDETTGTDDKFQPVIYSTEEREIGVWTDGKPLYQKTVIATNLTSGNNTVSNGISNIETIVENVSFIYKTGFSNQLPCISSISGWSARARDFSATDFVIELGSSLYSEGFTSASVTLQYTKTTDTAGSGQWTPQGVPAAHYSTDEKVVGTWIDGKTLYEKTIVKTYASLAMNASIDITSDLQNVGYVVGASNCCVNLNNVDYHYEYKSFNLENDNGTITIRLDIGQSTQNNVTFTATVQYTKASS